MAFDFNNIINDNDATIMGDYNPFMYTMKVCIHFQKGPLSNKEIIDYLKSIEFSFIALYDPYLGSYYFDNINNVTISFCEFQTIEISTIQTAYNIKHLCETVNTNISKLYAIPNHQLLIDGGVYILATLPNTVIDVINITKLRYEYKIDFPIHFYRFVINKVIVDSYDNMPLNIKFVNCTFNYTNMLNVTQLAICQCCTISHN